MKTEVTKKIPTELINIPNKAYRIALLLMERGMRKSPGYVSGDFFPLKHSFVNGMYIRQIFVPKGFIVLTYIHKLAYPAMQLYGDTTVIEESGNKRVAGPASFITEAGTQRICYCHEDTSWVTVHLNPTNEKDIDKIEENIYALHYSDLLNDEELAKELDILKISDEDLGKELDILTNKEDLCLE